MTQRIVKAIAYIFLVSSFPFFCEAKSFFEQWSDYNRLKRQELYDACISYLHDISPNRFSCPQRFQSREELRKEDPGLQGLSLEEIHGVPGEVRAYVQRLKRRSEMRERGFDLPTGLLLYGAPGTGKTTLAKAIAREAGCAFVSVGGSDFADKYIGEGERKIRDLFASVRASGEPTVVLIDEIDTLCLNRRESERNAEITALLRELDAVREERLPIFVIGTTNRYGMLKQQHNEALVRAGRFDHHVEMSLPDGAARSAILRFYLSKMGCELTDELPNFERATEALSGSEMRMVAQGAAWQAFDRQEELGAAHVQEEIERLVRTRQETLRRRAEEERVYFFDISRPTHKIEDCFAGRLPQPVHEVVAMLKDPESFQRVRRDGAVALHHILLVGPPGTGKSVLARAVAAEVGATFFSVTASDLMQKYVGESSKCIQEIFQQARSMDGFVIIFIDEVDSLVDGGPEESGAAHRDAFNKLLVEMVEHEKNHNLIVIGATNHIEIFDRDNALLRPGRFTIADVPLPDERTRLGILQLHGRAFNSTLERAQFQDIAHRTDQWSGAYLKRLVDVAGYQAGASKAQVVTIDHMQRALEVVSQERKQEKERRRSARELQREATEFGLRANRWGMVAQGTSVGALAGPWGAAAGGVIGAACAYFNSSNKG